MSFGGVWLAPSPKSCTVTARVGAGAEGEGGERGNSALERPISKTKLWRGRFGHSIKEFADYRVKSKSFASEDTWGWAEEKAWRPREKRMKKLRMPSLGRTWTGNERNSQKQQEKTREEQRNWTYRARKGIKWIPLETCDLSFIKPCTFFEK